LIDDELKEKLTSNSLDQHFSYENTFQQNNFGKRSSNGNISGSYSIDKAAYGGTGNNNYAPTYENLVNGSALSLNYDDLNEPSSGQESMKYLFRFKS
jgi:hypothetical protein